MMIIAALALMTCMATVDFDSSPVATPTPVATR